MLHLATVTGQEVIIERSMEKVMKVLDIHRTSFMRIHDATSKVLQSPNADMFEVQSNFNLLQQKMDSMVELDKKLLDLLVETDDSVSENIDAEVEKADQFICQFNELKLRIEHRLSSTDVINQDRQSQAGHTQNKLKLPKIEFKKFGGDIRDWLPFWSQFKRIHEDDQIEKEDKFQYLIQATIPKSRARLIVDSYPPSGENYPKAVESLKTRFGREDLLVEVYVRELLKLILNNMNGKSKLNYLYDNIETQLRALDTLGITSDKCAAMLYPLIESCLPEDILRVWQRCPQFSVDDNLKKRLDQLMNFLRKEVENEERIALASSSFELPKGKKKEDPSSHMIPSASVLVNTRIMKCHFCKMDHSSENCKEAHNISLSERKKILSAKGCCHLCLKFGHVARKCRTAFHLKCQNCGGKHATLMCSNTSEITAETKNIVPSTENLSNNTHNEVFLQTLMVLLKGSSKSRCVRAIIDTGSQRSYINKYTAIEMELDKIRTEDMVHALFGGFQSEITSHDCYKVCLESLDHNYACNLEVVDQPIICSNVVSICKGPWMEELRKLNVTVTDTKDGPIEILIGADVAGKLLSGPRHILKCGLVALKTSLGWTIMGKLKTPADSYITTSMLTTSLLSRSFSIPDLWNLDILGIADPEEKKSIKEHELAVMKYFSNTVTRDEEGRYQVSMPWIESHPPLPSNLELSMNRLEKLMVKLKNDGYYEEYNRVFEEWLSEGIIETLPVTELKDVGHYLPHRHVVKTSSVTTKLRPVFDASAKQKNHPSLNECLEKGINLITLIPTIFIGFRMCKFGVISDIKKAFLQISLHEHERNSLRFLWFNKSGDLILYRHARVVFGITCSPFLLGAVINHHLQKNIQQDTRFSKDINLKLLNSFYVDNCVTSVDCKEDLDTFIQQSREMMDDAKFDLRGWEYTCPRSDCTEISISLVLGMNWEKHSDTLRINFDSFKDFQPGQITKKVILSVANRIFDPLGFVSPVLLFPKIQLQKTWISKLGWNEEVPDEMKNTFLRWLAELNILTNLKIPRWIMHESSTGTSRELSLHVFMDASQLAYAAVIFLRTKSSNGITVQLIPAKSRVSPVKKISIPRLELLAASIGVRLLQSINEAFKENIPVFYWSDSTTVLSWIKRGDKWKPFVWNRIQEIRNFSRQESWFHVPGYMNPADLPSRGCTARQLLESRWWEGPEWLYNCESQWPKQEYQINEDLVSEENRKKEISLFTHQTIDFSWIYHYFSKYRRIINLIGWIRRFIFNCIHSTNKRNGQLSVEEQHEAEIFVVKCTQQDVFHRSRDTISSLLPFEDEDGILRIKTKISEREDSKEFRYPAVLPAKHPIVNRLILDSHIDLCHVGVQGLLSVLREKFWILGGRKSIKSVISKCTVCQRFDSKNCESAPVALPKDRVKDAAVFEIVGVDLFGHLFLRNKEKVWVCIFTCAVYRAVHLELVSSLTTDSFLQAFRRFIARRGRPAVVYSDNGGTFIGAKNALESLDWNEIEKIHKLEKIVWKLNIPTAAWWGGWWERLIRLIKQLLRKVCGRASLKYEELSSILCDCESVVNSRPLTYLSEDQSDLITLTPAMFLQDIKEVGVPDIDRIESNDLRRRFRYRNKLKEDLRRRFRKEYLGQLVLRKTKHHTQNLKVGDVVIVENETKNRINWPLGRIEELFEGKDGESRVVRLKTANGFIIRPIQRLHLLEMAGEENIVPLRKKFQDTVNGSHERGDEVITRSGRKIRPPDRLNL